MVTTLWCILVSVGAPFFFGLPLTMWLLRPKTDDDRAWLWILAPLVGVSTIVLLLQNLVYLDVPVRFSALWLWIAGGVAWVFLIASGQWTRVRASMPRALLLCALLVYFVQAGGLLIRGVDEYVGRLWVDQYNYTTTAQFLADEPFGFTYQDAAQKPYLFKAIQVKDIRIGQSILHAFVAVSCGLDAKRTFAPVMLSSCFFLVIALYASARRLTSSDRAALICSVAGGVLPAVTLLQIESFLSQGVCLPLLLVWPTVVASLLVPLRWSMLIPAAMIMASGASVYTEFVPLFLGVAAVVLTGSLLRQWRGWPLRLLACAALVAVTLALNCHYTGRLLDFMSDQLAQEGVLQGVYPWSLELEGLSRIWVGDLIERTGGDVPEAIGVCTVALMSLAYLGLARAYFSKRDPAMAGCAALALVAILLRIQGEKYPYQFYKILLSVAPLLPLGILAIRDALGRSGRDMAHPLQAVLDGCALLAIGVAASGSAEMTIRAGMGTTVEVTGRGMADRLLDPRMSFIARMLEGMHGVNVYVWNTDQNMNAWTAYFARKNAVYLGYPFISDFGMEIDEGPRAARRSAMRALPENLYVLDCSGGYEFTRRLQADLLRDRGARLWMLLKPFSLWQLSGSDWLFFPDIRDFVEFAQFQGRDWFLLGEGPMVLTAIAPRAGVARLRGLVQPGPSVPGADVCQVMVSSNAGFVGRFAVASGARTEFAVPLARGQTEIEFTALDKPTLRVQPNGDTRILLVMLEQLRVVAFEPPVTQVPFRHPLIRVDEALTDAIAMSEELQTAWPVEVVDGSGFLWVGSGREEGLGFELLCFEAIRLDLRLSASAGHGRKDARRNLVLECDGRDVWQGVLESAGELSIPVELSAGQHRIQFYCTDTATITRHPNGDTRNLLVALQGVEILPGR